MKQEFILSYEIEGSLKSNGQSIPVDYIRRTVKILKEEIDFLRLKDRKDGIDNRLIYEKIEILIDDLFGDKLT